MYSMLYASGLSSTSMRSMRRNAVFNQTGSPRRVEVCCSYGSISVKYLSQEYNSSLRNSRSELRVDNFEVANLHSNPMSYNADIAGVFALTAFSKDTASRYNLCEHQTSNLTIKNSAL